MTKSTFLQRMAADEKTEDAEDQALEDATDEKERKDPAAKGDLLAEVLDFARLHRSEIFRSEEPVPTKLKELKVVPGSIEESDFMVPVLLSGSDLSGDTVHVANYRAFLKRHAEEPGVFKVGGGYQAFGIAVLLSGFTEEILDELKGLEDNASLDDDILSGVEKDAIEDAWLDWARYDFVNALQAHLPEDADSIDELSDEQVMELFTTLRKQINAEWVFETGGKAFIEVDRIAADAKSADIPKAEAPVEPIVDEIAPVAKIPEEDAPVDKTASVKVAPTSEWPKTFTVVWQIQDRFGKGAFCHRATFESEDRNIVDMDAEAEIAKWMEANYLFGEEEQADPDLFINYHVYLGRTRYTEGRYNYYNDHEEF